MTNIKCVLLEDDRFNNIKESLETNLKIHSLQSYFPILSIYFDFHNNSDKQFKLKNIYSILNIKDKIQLEKDDTYIKHFFNNNRCSFDVFTIGSGGLTDSGSLVSQTDEYSILLPIFGSPIIIAVAPFSLM